VTVRETEPAFWETDTLSAENAIGSAAAVVAAAAGAAEGEPEEDAPLAPPHPVRLSEAKTAKKAANRSTCDVRLVHVVIQTPRKKNGAVRAPDRL
jgi:hypothetical protein